MVELEKKILLARSEYEGLLQLTKSHTKSYVQVNYYYDTDSLEMNRRGITCRIREKNGKWKATIKTHRVKESECSFEKTKEVSGKYDDSFFYGMNIKLQGSLTTVRTILYAEKGLEIALDENIYLDTRDYELEIEYVPENAEYAEYMLFLLSEFLQVQNDDTNAEEFRMRTKSSKSKSERFFEHWKSAR